MLLTKKVFETEFENHLRLGLLALWQRALVLFNEPLIRCKPICCASVAAPTDLSVKLRIAPDHPLSSSLVVKQSDCYQDLI